MGTDSSGSKGISEQYRQLEQLHEKLADPAIPLEEAVALYKQATATATTLKAALRTLEQELEEIDVEAASGTNDR